MYTLETTLILLFLFVEYHISLFHALRYGLFFQDLRLRSRMPFALFTEVRAKRAMFTRLLAVRIIPA